MTLKKNKSRDEEEKEKFVTVKGLRLQMKLDF